MDNEAVGRMDYENFNAAIVNVHQLQQSGDWENRIRKAFESFDKDGNEFVEAEDLIKVRQLSALRMLAHGEYEQN
jgi:Ca2+-binding EF-hand superfamily protein